MVSCSICDEEFDSEHAVSVHKGHSHGPHTETCVRCGEEFRIPPNKADSVEQCSDCYEENGHTERRNQSISESRTGWEWSEEMKKQMSESHTGKILSEEHRENIGKANQGERNDMYGLTGEDHPAYGNEGWKESVWEVVEETGHAVKSAWEKEIDLLLHESDIDYGYESTTFNFGELTYTPDFVLDDVIIEVKGYPRQRCQLKAKNLMEEYSEFTYVVVGNRQSPEARIPCGVHIPWEDRKEVLSI